MTEKQKERLQLLKALEAQLDSEQRLTWSLDAPQFESDSKCLRENLKEAKEIVKQMIFFRLPQTEESERDQGPVMERADRLEKERLVVQALWEQVRSMGLLLDMLANHSDVKDEQRELKWLMTQMRSCLRNAGKKLPDPVDEFLEEIRQYQKRNHF